MDLNTLKVQYNIFNGVLKDLYEHYGFLSDVEEGFTEGYLDKFSCEFDCNYNDLEIELKWGVTKAVICLPDNEWVLKIPFSDYEFDYCSLEEKNYISAKREGFEDFMAETHYLMDFNGSPCYIMKKAEVGFDLLKKDMYSCLIEEGNSEEYARYNSELNCSGDEYVENLLSFHYDHKRLDNFLDFCEENDINDIHTGNVGYINGRLVVIDYSGYHG